jgi:hypothetical protein
MQMKKQFDPDFIRKFEIELLDMILWKFKEWDAWECFVLLIDKYEVDPENAIRLWYEMRLTTRKHLRGNFNKKYHSCSKYR